MAGLRRYAGEPGLDVWVVREVEITLVCHVRVGIERNVGEAVAAADKERPRFEMLLHHVESGIASLSAHRQVELLQGRQGAEEMPPEADDGDVRLVAVLLEEHPLQ